MKWILMAVAILLSWQAQAQRVYWKEHRDFAEMVINVLHPTEDNDLQPVKDSSARCRCDNCDILISSSKTYSKRFLG